MKYSFLILFILLINNSLLLAQTDVEIIKKEFKTVKPGLKIAWKHIKDGDNYYSDGGILYKNALNEYLKANEYNNGNDGLNYKIGVSYLFSDEKDKAYDYLLKAYNINNNVAPDILFLTGMAYQYAGKYNEAVVKYTAFLSGTIRKSDNLIARTNKRIEECNSAMKIMNDTLLIDIQNAGSNINSDSDEYSEIISGDGRKLFFASRRVLIPGARSYYKDSKPDENIYVSENIDGKWSAPTTLGKNLITNFCETPLFIDKSGVVLYIYAGYEGNGNIKYAELKKGEWKSPRSESFGLNTPYPETSFCFAPSGDEIAFVSDRDTYGFGGKDIFFVKRNGKKWGRPVNAGEAINTIYNEESVRYSTDGDTLWFSSSGHNSIGGFDVFYSVRKEGDGWGPAVNAGYPINTSWNDLFYLPSPIEKGLFYFVSDRKGGFGGLDIYTGTIRTTSAQVAPRDQVTVNPDSLQVVDSIKIGNGQKASSGKK